MPSFMIFFKKFETLARGFNIIDVCIGLVDTDIVNGMHNKDADILNLKNRYYEVINNPQHKWSYKFSFPLCKIMHKEGNKISQLDTFPIVRTLDSRLDKLAFHIYNVVYYCSHRLSQDPTISNYHLMISMFNISANFINQYFSDKVVSLVHNPRARQRPKSQKFKIGIMINGLHHDDINVRELNGWKLEFTQLVNTHDIEWVKINRKDLYTLMLAFHRNGRTMVHGGDGNPHYWIRENMWEYAKVINMFLNNKHYGGIVTRTNKANYINEFTEYTQFSKKHYSNKKINVGDICVPCPCLCEEDSLPCSCLFNLSDSMTFESFTLAFKDYSIITDINDVGDQVPDPVKIMFATLEVLRNPSLRPNNRLKSTCPQCKFVNDASDEAKWNNSGNTPLLSHPCEVVCKNLECSHKYCTDCLQYHPGIICRGFVEDPECDPNVQLCPACSHTTYRVDGCTCITCELPNCRKTWCWICRCLRHPEQHERINPDLIHYCMDVDRYITNPSWRNNPEFKPYRQLAPSGRGRLANLVPE